LIWKDYILTYAVYYYAIAWFLKDGTVFHQICIEGNIASGKTTCLDYFAQTTSIEVLDLCFFVFIYIIEQLLVLTKLTGLEVVSSLK